MRTAKALNVGMLTATALGAGYGLGYLGGSDSSHKLAIIGRLVLAAILFLVLAMLARIIVAVLVHRKGGPPPDGGNGEGGPRPPRAPVPRPPDGRPPALSAAAEIKLGPAT